MLVAFFASGWLVFFTNPTSLVDSLVLFFSYLSGVLAVSLVVLLLLIRWRERVMSSVPLDHLRGSLTQIPWDKVTDIELRGKSTILRTEEETYRVRFKSSTELATKFLKSKVGRSRIHHFEIFANR